MDSVLRKGLFLVTLTGAVAAFPVTAHAGDLDQVHLMPGVGIEQVLNDCYSSDKEIVVEDYLVAYLQKRHYRFLILLVCYCQFYYL